METLHKGQRVRLKAGTTYAYQNSGVGTVNGDRSASGWVGVNWDKAKTGYHKSYHYPVSDLLPAHEKWKKNFKNL